MVEKVEDLQLPNAVVQRIIKEALPDGINVAKDARTEISRAASIFVLYLTNTARSQLKNKKTLTATDVINALEVMEMEHLVEPLKKSMEQYKQQQKTKKDKKQPESSNTATSSETPTATEEPDEEELEETENIAEDLENSGEAELPETEQMTIDPPSQGELPETEPIDDQV